MLSDNAMLGGARRPFAGSTTPTAPPAIGCVTAWHFEEGTSMDPVDPERPEWERGEWQRVTSALRKGGVDEEGEKIILVYRLTGDFAIYITENGVKHLSREPVAGRFASVADAAFELNFYRDQFAFVDLAVAQAKVACLEGNAAQAAEILAHTHRRVVHLLAGSGRLRYILVCMVTSGVAFTTAFVLSLTAVLPETVFVAWVVACGSLGSFLSVSLNLTGLQVDPEAPRLMTTVSAVSRIVIGMIGAAFILLVIKGNLVLGILADVKNPAAILAVAVVAGFSETFVPNVLRRVEGKADGKEPSEPPS